MKQILKRVDSLFLRKSRVAAGLDALVGLLYPRGAAAAAYAGKHAPGMFSSAAGIRTTATS